MLIRTHFLITLFFVLILIPSAENKAVLAVVALAATFIPDVDTRFSKLGRKKIFRILQFFVKHRGFLHSFTFLILITIVFYFVLPIIAFPFFLGYGLHLVADALTIQGIKPFYPLKGRIRGFMRTGRIFETILFVIFLVADLALFFSVILSISFI